MYNWEFVWIDAGRVEFEVREESFNGNRYYRFKSSGRSLTTYDWLYKVREKFTSVADAVTFRPVYYSRKSIEGNYFANEEVNFDWLAGKIYSQVENSKKGLVNDTLPLNDFILDVQTAVYYARTLDFSNMQPNEKIPFRMIIDGEIIDLYGRYLGVETIENYDGRLYRCHKFSALLVAGTIFSGGEDLFIWVTDDMNHIPILVEAKILVGSVKAVFTRGANLVYPIDAEIR